MWARTKTHHTEESLPQKKRQGWRALFNEELESHSEQGLYLKGLRLRDGFTQAELGSLIGISPNNISAMERGRRSIGKRIAQRLSQVFKVHYNRFL